MINNVLQDDDGDAGLMGWPLTPGNVYCAGAAAVWMWNPQRATRKVECPTRPINATFVGLTGKLYLLHVSTVYATDGNVRS